METISFFLDFYWNPAAEIIKVESFRKAIYSSFLQLIPM